MHAKMDGMIDTKQRIDAIELLRFMAAMSVVCAHMPLIACGHFGVDTFFVISGFVMLLSTEKNADHFFTKRLIRIVPLYYLLTLCVFFTTLRNNANDYSDLIQSLLFIPYEAKNLGHSPIMPIGWTLNFEMYFYGLFALALKISHRHRAWLSTSFLAAIFTLSHPWSLPYALALVFEFVLGMIAYALLINRDIKTALLLLTTVVAALLYATPSFDDRLYTYGIPAFLLLCLVVKVLENKTLPSWIVALGSASYSLYLTHDYILQLFIKYHLFSGALWQKTIVGSLALLAINAIALMVYKYLEYPMLTYLRQRRLH